MIKNRLCKKQNDLEPKNKIIEPLLVKLHAEVQSKINMQATTKNKVDTMAQLGKTFTTPPTFLLKIKGFFFF